MFVILETNNDPAGGGSAFQYVTSKKSFAEASEYVDKHSGPWRSFVIAEIMNDKTNT